MPLFKKKEICPCCGSKKNEIVTEIESYKYYLCKNCGLIFIDNETMNRIDKGDNIVKYDEAYWDSELSAAKARSYRDSLARMAEVILYARIPISIFLDIGSGPGFFLDAISKYLPNSMNKFYGIEKFPPIKELRTLNKNYIVGDVKNFPHKVDAGICVEVVEHMTPKMVRNLFVELSEISKSGAIYLFNSGMPEYVLNENIKYLDPIKNGHIASYSIKSLSRLCSDLGFVIYPLQGKTWAYIIEYKPALGLESNMQVRVWTPLPENKKILSDPDMGGALELLGFDTARAYGDTIVVDNSLE